MIIVLMKIGHFALNPEFFHASLALDLRCVPISIIKKANFEKGFKVVVTFELD